jgi:hypothetical protein
MELNSVLTAISLITIFFSGYFCRRRNMTGFVICAFVAQIPTSVTINMVGISKYAQNIVDTPTDSWITALIFVSFIWGIGYICGGINIRKKDNEDDLPGKDVKYEGHMLD